MSKSCELVDAWLYQAADVADDSLPPDEIVAHVVGCPRCRLALVALLVDRIGLAEAPLDAACAAVEEAIPAFVDYERVHGMVAAARAFPSVWWHMLICPDCDELYRALHTLAEQPVALEASGAGWPALAATPLAELEIHPGVMRQYLSLPQSLGMAWGNEGDDMIISEQGAEIGLIQLSLRHEAPDRFALVVRTDPPIQGMALLALGGRRYDEPLDLQGCAVFSGLDEALLGGGGEPIRLRIQPRPA